MQELTTCKKCNQSKMIAEFEYQSFGEAITSPYCESCRSKDRQKLRVTRKRRHDDDKPAYCGQIRVSYRYWNEAQV